MFKSMTSASALRNQEKRASQIQSRQTKGNNTDESGAKWEKSQWTKNWFFEKINDIDISLASMIRKKKKERRYKLPILGMREVTSLQILQILKGQ